MATKIYPLAAVLAALVIAAGCGAASEPDAPTPSRCASPAEVSQAPSPVGGSEAAALRNYVASIGAPLESSDAQEVFQAASAATGAFDPDESSTWLPYQESMRALARLVDEWAADLRTIDPPRRLAEAHEKLIAAGEATADIYAFVAESVEKGDTGILEGDTPPPEIEDRVSTMKNEMVAFTEAVLAEADRLGIEIVEGLPNQLLGQ